MGGGFSNSANMSHQASDSTNFGGAVWNQQSPYLQDVYAQGQRQYQMGGGEGQGQFNAGGQALTGSDQAYQRSMQQQQQANGYFQGSMGGVNAANQGYGQSMANLSGMANPNQANPMLDIYAKQLGQNLNEQILPGMRGQAAAAGQLGGSRDQIGQALATSRTGQQLQDFAGQLYSDDQNRALQANLGLQSGASGYLQGAGVMQNIGQGLNQGAQVQQGAGAGMTANAGMYGNYAQLAGQLPWQNLQQYSALLGGPVVMDQGGQSTSRARAWGGSMAGNFSL